MNNRFDARILALDDDPLMLRLLVSMLSTLGFSAVTTATNGHAALELFAPPNNWPDLILVDLNMPEMDGVEFIRLLAENNYTGSLILISGEDGRILLSVRKLVQAHRIDILGYLRKPLICSSLATLLETWSPGVRSLTAASKESYSPERISAAIYNGELTNYYQPKVSLATGRVVGVETLVRWHHPEDGLIFPDQFVGIAETNGLIDALTRWVLADALAQSSRWALAGFDLHVAINVSMDNLSSLSFVDFVAEQAALVHVPPGSVILEITESRLMQDQRTPLEILARLRLKRFRLSIDDFGTGHSSLAQLHDIAFNELKIDRSFVHGAAQDATTRAIFDASLALALQLDIDAVAEGVEDRSDWDMLRNTRCKVAQGYFISRPLPAAQLPDWIGAWNRRAETLIAEAA